MPSERTPVDTTPPAAPLAAEPELESPLRLHPFSLIFIFAGLVRRFLVPAAVVIAASFLGSDTRDSRYELWAAAFFLPAAVMAVLRYFSFRYRMLASELVVSEGLFHRTERHVPYARIQNVDTSQNVFHRLLGVAEATVETAGGEGAEARLRVLSNAAIESLRARVVATRAAAAPSVAASDVDVGRDRLLDAATGRASAHAAPPPASALDHGGGNALAPDSGRERETLVRVPLRALLFVGAFSLRGWAVVGMGMGLFWQFGGHEESRIREAFSWIHQLDLGHGLAASLKIVAGAGVFLVLVVALSMILTVVRFYGFTLTRQGDELRTHFGLFTQRTFTVPRHRVQLILVEEPWWLRMRGLVSVQVRTAGGDGGPAGRSWLTPVWPRARLGELLARIHPDLRAPVQDWQSLHPATRRRLLRIEFVVTLIACGALTLWLGAWAWLALLPLLLACSVSTSIRARCTHFQLTEAILHHRAGVLRRVQISVPFAKIQSIRQFESPFDRRWGMTGLHIDTAGASAVGGGVTIRYLPRDVGDRLRRRLGREAARSEFRW